ncbi:HSP20 family protein [Halomicrobium zhouii]|uniref:HSP20 family protein n=1 Tax=Halomicrobium zhouii TaxID=767519 RepID=A0A1I6LXA6_9EURY|nr:Hsp20/alpha crystallin family protein [Halomicrobium zhouii]SFS08014.1 HSP20 family protein [Halomicrobium zhouii]
MRRANDPFEQMEAIFEQMRRSMLGAQGAAGRPMLGDGTQAGPTLTADGSHDAGVTVEERDGEYVVLADLPGFEREEIDLTFDDGVLTIDGTHEVTDDHEYRQRTVSESVRIPAEVVVDDVNATYRNGVLEVTLPVEAAASDAVRIDVE